MDRNVAGSWRPNYPKPEREKVAVRDVIQAARPDILVLQEMGTLDFLEELRADLNQEGLHYPYAVHLSGPDPVRHVAMLSMYPPEEVVKHKHLDFKYFEGRQKVKRGLLEVTFRDADNKRFTIFGLHLKSRWTDDKRDPESEMRRTREAEACRNLIISRTVDVGHDRFMVVGDFNSHPGGATLRRFYKRGKLNFGTQLTAYDTRGAVWTYFYQKESEYKAVDGFVLSKALVPEVEAGTGHIVDTVSALHGSDHRMVYADFLFGSPSSPIQSE
jgi:endonuclease/exonuclease/phosphatase family metal-dependent hydrolase